MGRVPLLVLLTACTALVACAPEADAPTPEDPQQSTEAVRDAGQAAREAMKKAGEALRRLSGRPAETEALPPPGNESQAPVGASEAPVPDAPPVTVPAPTGLPTSGIAPVPDETEQLEQEQHIQVERDAGVATQEAKQKILEATRKAAERFRMAGEGMVDAFRKDDLDADNASDTMGDAQAEPEAGPATTDTPAKTPRPE